MVAGITGQMEDHTMIIADAREYLQTARYDDLIAAIVRKYNCYDADVNEEGDVYIRDPKNGCWQDGYWRGGYWLSDDKLVELVKWIKAQ